MLKWFISKQQATVDQYRRHIDTNRRLIQAQLDRKAQVKQDLVSIEGLTASFLLGCLAGWKASAPTKSNSTKTNKTAAGGKSIRGNLNLWVNTAMLVVYYLDKFKIFNMAEVQKEDKAAPSPSTPPGSHQRSNSQSTADTSPT